MAAVDEHDWVIGPHARECQAGCKLAEARRLLASAEKLVGRTAGGQIVSQALWCDQGDHPFSARDPKSEHWERQVTNDKGEKVTVPWDVCGKCMAKIDQRLAAMELEARNAD